jgi:hypothetical protein
MVLENHAFRLAQIEARIRELVPQMNLPPRLYKPNPLFARIELPGSPSRSWGSRMYHW